MFFLLKYNQSRMTQARDKQVEEKQDQSMKGCSVNSERCKNIHRNCNSGHIGLHIHKDSWNVLEKELENCPMVTQSP